MKVGNTKLLLEIVAKDVHGIWVYGTVSKILKNTIIVSKGVDNYLIKIKELEI